MEQILPIQPTTPQATQPSAGDSDAQSDFSPHLDAALKNQTDTKADPAVQGNNTDSTIENNLNEPETQASQRADTDQNTQTSQISVTASLQLQQTIQTGPGQSDDQQTLSALLFKILGPENSKLLGAETLTKPETPPSAATDSTFTSTVELKAAATLALTHIQQSGPPQTTSTHRDKLIAQLQQIIDNSSETGKVSITQTTSSSKSSLAQNSADSLRYQSPTQQQLQVSTDGNSPTASVTVSTYLSQEETLLTTSNTKQNHELNGVRVDTKQQFYDAKIGGQAGSANDQKNQNSADDGDSSNQLGQQSGSSKETAGTTPNSEQPNTFSQVTSTTQSVTTPGTTDTAKPMIPFTHNLAHEQEVLQQLADKFRINTRRPDTNINIKLHPAELGEVKIDLTVKEGSIRANVVAMSQHVQEILEKNLPKLKSLLEDQGFTVDEILVTSESDSVGAFDLFDNQLFNNQDNFQTPQKGSPKSASAFLVEDSELVVSPESSGVNVTA